MLDIKLIREKPEIFINDLEKRGDQDKMKLLEQLIKKDTRWRKLNSDVEKMKHDRNKISKEIAELKSKGLDAKAKMKEAANIPVLIEEIGKESDKLKKEVDEILMRLPNILHESVPYGESDKDNVEIRNWGEKKKFDFEVLTHGEIAEKLDVADFERASKLSGKGFYCLKGDLALLQNALIRFAIDKLAEKGYILIDPPLMMRREPYEGVTDLGDFETMMYKIDNEDLYLIATSEHPMAALYMNGVIPDKDIPIKFIGLSPCFRREIGSHGVDEKGLFRVHQFYKVEQFIFCAPEDSWKYHEELISNAEEIFKALEIPYRIVNVCTGDIGTVAAKKYDLEIWSPRQNKYIEAVSCSNCTDYQARRLNIRMGKHGGDKRLVHTLNSTAIALSRALVGILENYQQKDGTVTIPKVLVPYMNGKKIISKE